MNKKIASTKPNIQHSPIKNVRFYEFLQFPQTSEWYPNRFMRDSDALN